MILNGIHLHEFQRLSYQGKQTRFCRMCKCNISNSKAEDWIGSQDGKYCIECEEQYSFSTRGEMEESK